MTGVCPPPSLALGATSITAFPAGPTAPLMTDSNSERTWHKATAADCCSRRILGLKVAAEDIARSKVWTRERKKVTFKDVRTSRGKALNREVPINGLNREEEYVFFPGKKECIRWKVGIQSKKERYNERTT